MNVGHRASPRIFRLTPDLHYWRIVDEALDRSRLSIFPYQPLSAPSLLFACQESRAAAYRDYVRWGATYSKNFVPSGKVAYLNKAYDTVYFVTVHSVFSGSWTCYNIPQGETRSWCYEMETLALRKYVDQLSGIRNIAIPRRQLLTSS
jgi:hypothetical protein